MTAEYSSFPLGTGTMDHIIGATKTPDVEHLQELATRHTALRTALINLGLVGGPDTPVAAPEALGPINLNTWRTAINSLVDPEDFQPSLISALKYTRSATSSTKKNVFEDAYGATDWRGDTAGPWDVDIIDDLWKVQALLRYLCYNPDISSNNRSLYLEGTERTYRGANNFPFLQEDVQASSQSGTNLISETSDESNYKFYSANVSGSVGQLFNSYHSEGVEARGQGGLFPFQVQFTRTAISRRGYYKISIPAGVYLDNIELQIALVLRAIYSRTNATAEIVNNASAEAICCAYYINPAPADTPAWGAEVPAADRREWYSQSYNMSSPGCVTIDLSGGQIMNDIPSPTIIKQKSNTQTITIPVALSGPTDLLIGLAAWVRERFLPTENVLPTGQSGNDRFGSIAVDVSATPAVICHADV